jgi:hypothetical protein
LRPLFCLYTKGGADFSDAIDVLLFFYASIAFCLLDDRLTFFVRALILVSD